MNSFSVLPFSILVSFRHVDLKWNILMFYVSDRINIDTTETSVIRLVFNCVFFASTFWITATKI